MHWVVAEAVNAAATLHRVTGDNRYAEDAARWWAYADRCLVDHELGGWHHQLDRHNHVVETLWPGKPDTYHAYQAALLPILPLAPSIAAAAAGAATGTPRPSLRLVDGGEDGSGPR
jgi:mannose/cellobiose epimerase-like protein (N-acyl-D-glucosamine 2-epimerase family)